ncbi:glycosyltransferase family 4 protein [Sphingobacterium corticibacterium]|uniref:Glycosyltransferase family 4 protein n=1 Tax=Sphingobacterium corticibacterium TaxID=2484746 RepID=A0A4Q6XYJ0_9SPHI|nr:glycosyltransferase family 4 protein [Sphingobacterium corticibacterium]
MKIVFCIAGTFNSGGMERVLANKANYLVTKGYEVCIVTTDQKARLPHFAMDSRIVHYDLDINYLDLVDKGLIGKTIGYFRKQKTHFDRLNTLLCTLKADIVISMFDHEANLVWKIKDGSKKILEIHFSRFKRLQYGRKGLWRLADRWRNRRDLQIAKRYDRFVVLTQEDKAYWENLSHIQVIPNANSFRPDEISSVGEKRVIAVGRLSYQKGFDDLLDIWASVLPYFPDWTLDIFGEGELKEMLQSRIDRLGIGENTHLCMPVSHIQEEYGRSAILVMTSRYEGLPMALLEAQACGLPLLAYACKCGPRDIINDGENGFLIGEGDKTEFARKIMLLMGDISMRRAMGKQSRLLSQNFSEERIMSEWENLFKNIIKS